MDNSDSTSESGEPMTVHVELELSQIVYLRLRVLAQLRAQTVTALVVEHTYRLAHINDQKNAVLELWSQGRTDKQMAAELGWLVARVAKHRRGLNLLPNNNPKARTK